MGAVDQGAVEDGLRQHRSALDVMLFVHRPPVELVFAIQALQRRLFGDRFRCHTPPSCALPSTRYVWGGSIARAANRGMAAWHIHRPALAQRAYSGAFSRPLLPSSSQSACSRKTANLPVVDRSKPRHYLSAEP